MKILYFAWLRERVGHAEEDLALPTAVTSVGELIAYLRARGSGYEQAFSNPTVIRVAVNQSYVKFDHPLNDSDEVAIFPPVTGG